MTLASIPGAPAGAFIPDFPIEGPATKPAQPTAAPAFGDLHPTAPMRHRQTPINIRGSGITLTFRVLPEMPTISRASMTIHAVTDATALGFLRMSAASTRAFLTDLWNGRSPIVATGDEDGTVQIEYEIREGGAVFLVHRQNQPNIVHHCIIDRSFDLKTVADELLADLGA